MLSEIKTSLFTQLEANTALPIYYDNVDSDVPTSTHLRPFVLPATTDTIGTNDLGKEQGLLQVNVYTLKGSGQLDGVVIAEAMIAIFPRSLALTGVRIDEYGSIGPSLLVDSWQVTPVSFPYYSLID